MSDTALEDDLPVAEIIACRPNGNLTNEFVVTVMCPYSDHPTLYGIEGKVGDEVFKKVPTHRHKRREKVDGDEKGFYIEGIIS